MNQANFKIISSCRVCGENELTPVMSLGNQYLTGVFPNCDEAFSLKMGPVDLVRCSSVNGCGLVQLLQSYSAEDMYGENYGYRSGLNPTMVAHLSRKVENIRGLVELNAGDVVIDVGSNDGSTLSFYPEGCARLIGFDPTATKFLDYYRKDIEIVCDFFTKESVANKLLNVKAKIITSFSMFYDLESPIDFAKTVRDSLSEDGVWVFEQSYLLSMIETNSFDTICHEHLEFYAFYQIEYILEKAGMHVIDLEFNDVNGGSISIVAAKSTSSFAINETAIHKIRENETNAGIFSDDFYLEFTKRVDHVRESLLSLLNRLKAENKTVYALGASTKGNVLLQYFGIDSELIRAVGEVNQEKFGKYTPGSNIPIIDESSVLDANPDYLLVLPWHFKEYFLNDDKYRNRQFIFPLPGVEIIKNI